MDWAVAVLISLALFPLYAGLAGAIAPCKHPASSSGGSRDSGV